jgi:exopolysaccharide biosynthesis polyprenyl glycosylphosphotransferase
MIRLFRVYFPTRVLVLAVLEAMLISFALMIAAVIWFGSDAELKLVYENGFVGIVVVTGTCVLCMYYYDLYNTTVISNQREVPLRAIQAFGATCVVLALMYYAFPGVRLNRGVVVFGLVLTGVGLMGSRTLFVRFNRSTQLSQRTVLLGCGPLVHLLTAQIGKHPELGIEIVGYLERATAVNGDLSELKRLGDPEEVERLVERERVSRVVFSGDAASSLPIEALLRLKASGIVVQDVAVAYESVTGQVPVCSLRPIWLLLSDGFRISRATLLYKRIASVAGSILGLLISAPLMALVALAVRLDSPGPVIFRQQRVGKDGKRFTIYKFRSMRDGSECDLKPAEKNDGRFTRVGRYIRQMRLDELPQLYNILRGDMCFVGPRPFIPEEEEFFARTIPMYRGRWAVRPGATGWAQVQKGYCATLQDNIEKLGFDLFYIENLSMGLDFLILFQTIKVLLLGRGAR